MIHLLKLVSKSLLKRFNRTLCYSSYPITGCHFPDDLRLVVGRDDPVCFDVGAHWGETIRELRAIFPRPVIHAFEPARDNLSILQKLHGTPGLHIHGTALADMDGEKNFTLYEDSLLNSFLEIATDGPLGNSRPKGIETVVMERLDTVVTRQGLDRIDLLKIDAQGYEMPILLGGERMLSERRIGALLLEVNFSHMYDGQSSFSALLEHLGTRGYALVDFYQKARVGQRLSWCNALFTRLD
jgi:FkbM family methyltransferase